MRKKILLTLLLCISFFAFCEKKEYDGDLNSDGVNDLLIEECSCFFDSENDNLNMNVKVIVRLKNADGSVRKEVSFSENRIFYDDEYDGCLSYFIEDNLIVRNLIVGRHSYKNYIDMYFSFDSESDNWTMCRKKTLKAPLHENVLTEEYYKDKKVMLYDKATLLYSGNDQ